MTELKTLKELILPYTESDGSMGWISPTEIRQEAIKWIKQYKKDLKSTKTEITITIIRARISWIKAFFNITEEELK